MDQMKASNATFLDDNTGGKGKYFRARILQAGLVKYSFGVCLLEKDTIDKFIYDFVGCPVIIDHKDVTNENAKEERVGVISRVWFSEADGWFWVEGVIFDEEAIGLINDGYNVSCQYEISEYANNVGKKLHNGNPFDKVILNGKPEHLAIVKNPRYENAMIAVNALDATNKDDEDVEWITVKGNHIPIKKGQSKEEAVKEFIESRQDKSEKSDTKKDAQKTTQKITKQMEVEHIIDEFYEEPFVSAEQLDRLGKTLGAKISDDELYDIIDKNRDVLKSGQKSDDFNIEAVAKDLQKLATDKSKEAKKREKEHNELKKQDTLRYDLKSILKKHSPYADYRYDEEDKTLEVRYWGDWEGDDGSGDYDWQTPTQKTKDKIEQIKKDFKKQYGYDLQVGTGEKNWMYFSIKEEKDKENKSNKTKDTQSDGSSKESLIEKALLHGEPEGTQVWFKITKPMSTHGHINKADETSVEYRLYDKNGKPTQGTTSTTFTDKYLERFKENNKKDAKNSIIQAINEIKETDMFKNLFKKKENKMDKDELKSLFMECLSELTAKNEADEKKEDDKLADDKVADNEEDDKKEDKKDEEKADNKCRNEVVDKRDIIRQIMAIAGKEEASEDVKEIAKLAEKLAYDKSEADKKADNKCKNEDDKEDDKKVGNEEKEDEKEKASNSLDEIIGKMSAGTFERKSESYMTQKKAVELGDKLF